MRLVGVGTFNDLKDIDYAENEKHHGARLSGLEKVGSRATPRVKRRARKRKKKTKKKKKKEMTPDVFLPFRRKLVDRNDNGNGETQTRNNGKWNRFWIVSNREIFDGKI